MKVMFELDAEDIKKLAGVDVLDELLETLKSTAKEAKAEPDGIIISQIKKFVEHKRFRGPLHAMEILASMNDAIKETGYITISEFVELLDGDGANDDLEANYEHLCDYGWNRILTLKDTKTVYNYSDGIGLVLDANTIVHLD